ncbi:MAG: hypothetical protein AABW80_04640 [Nanoarchaeota archaeon]
MVNLGKVAFYGLAFGAVFTMGGIVGSGLTILANKSTLEEVNRQAEAKVESVKTNAYNEIVRQRELGMPVTVHPIRGEGKKQMLVVIDGHREGYIFTANWEGFYTRGGNPRVENPIEARTNLIRVNFSLPYR